MCDDEKLITDFRKDKTQKDGRQPRCKICARKTINANYSKYRDKTLMRNAERARVTRLKLREYKEARSCSFCSENNYVCLDFHHIDPNTKSFQLSSVTTESWETIMDEINKCSLVCKNCHAKIHAKLINL
jgi:hypothetical protein